jgi:hypothetical protein
MYIKKPTRVTFKSNRRPNFKRNNNFTNGKPRNKGNVSQQYNKYLKLAKEAFSSGDRVQSEYYYQFTDHYYRIMMELGIALEDNEENSEDKYLEEVSQSNEDTDVVAKKVPESSSEKNNDEEDKDENLDSIESIPFISEPIKKKKLIRSKKTSV